jgi:hypothetical protein
MCFGKTLKRDKLSNSGDTLKLMVLSFSRKAISGWINYPCIVISHKIDEKKMGNRGSKSEFKVNSVKEQRADGSWCIKPKLMYLRCALTGFERNYQLNNLSNQYNKLPYSTLIKKSKLNFWFITGFADAESSFSVLIQFNDKYKTNWRVKPVFSITLHKKDVAILENIKNTLGVGKVNINESSKVIYRVESFKELEIIINHFNNYPLVTAKLSDFFIFKQCFEIIKEGKHLTKDGLLKIIRLKFNLNLGLPKNLIEAFPKIIPNIKSDYIFKGIPDPFWVSGFISGDGSFNVKIGNSATTSIGVRVQLRFGIGLHIRELDVVKGLAAYFNLLYPLASKSVEVVNVKYKNITTTSKVVNFQVTKFSDIVNIITPFFNKYPIQGQKVLDFEDFKKVVEIMKVNDHLTVKGFEKIKGIKEGMNHNRLW